MREHDDRGNEPDRDAEPAERPYEPPRVEQIEGDDRAVAGAWITPFPDDTSN